MKVSILITLILLLSACGNANTSSDTLTSGAFNGETKQCACPCINPIACNSTNWMGYYSKIECVSQSGQHFSANNITVCEQAI